MKVPAGNKACPLCGWTDFSLLKIEGKRSAFGCAHCTLGWTYPPCGDEDYEGQFFGKDGNPQANRAARRKLSDLPKQHQKAVLLQADLCARSAPPGGRVLDIGCADGLLMEQLTARDLRCQGIDPSIEATELAKTAGFDVVQGYFPHPELHGPVDVVSLSHVFEHVPDPTKFLQDLAEIAPGGRAVFCQTNYRGIIPRTFRQWYYWCLEGHFWHFTPKSHRRLLEESGFEVESITQLSMTHLSRRHKYFLNLIDMLPGQSDQYLMVARIPKKTI